MFEVQEAYCNKCGLAYYKKNGKADCTCPHPQVYKIGSSGSFTTVEPMKEKKIPFWYPGKKLKDGSIYVGMAYDPKRKQFYRFALRPEKYVATTWDQAVQLTGLPTREELSMIYGCLPPELRMTDGCLPPELRMTDGWHWSSTEYNNTSAWVQRFSDGYQYNGLTKYTSNEVRCVRRFGYLTI